MSGHPQNTGLGRSLASRRQTTSADVWRNPDPAGGKRSAPVLHTTGILLHIAAPDARSLQLLSDLGAERADVLGELPYDADVTEGDELHIGQTIYQIERAVPHDTLTLCALWELKQ